MFVCRPFEPHWGISVVGKQLPTRMLLFSPTLVQFIPDGFRLLIPFYSEWLNSPLIPSDTVQAKAITSSFNRAFNKTSTLSDMNQPIQFICVIEILIQIYNFAKLQTNTLTTSNEMTDIINAIQYLLKYFRDIVSINEVIEHIGYKKSNFFDKFQSFTGTTPHHFLNRLRIQYAMACLTRYTDMSILTISEECGFQSLRSFNDQFKKYTGMSPSKYRSSHNKDPLT